MGVERHVPLFHLCDVLLRLEYHIVGRLIVRYLQALAPLLVVAALFASTFVPLNLAGPVAVLFVLAMAALVGALLRGAAAGSCPSKLHRGAAQASCDQGSCSMKLLTEAAQRSCAGKLRKEAVKQSW